MFSIINSTVAPLHSAIKQIQKSTFSPILTRLLLCKRFLHFTPRGESIKNILAMLKDKGLKNQKGKDFSYNFITNLLKNRRYLGEYRFKDTVVENAFTPLITQDIFDKCQKRMAANKHKPAHFKEVDDTYILTEKIFCGYCGGPHLRCKRNRQERCNLQILSLSCS